MSLSSLVKFGTSSWTYESWTGIVYFRRYSKERFKQDCLAEYAQYRYRGRPLFRTVGFDQTFYSPPTPSRLAHYAGQLPAYFEVCSKVWEEITIPRYADLPRYGPRRDKPNSHFLDASLFKDSVLAPYREVFAEHTGPFIFEFQRQGIESPEFLSRLDDFLGKLPKRYRYGIEIRNPLLLSPTYHAILTNHEVSHVYNHWTSMPPLHSQHERLGERFTAPFVLLRLLTPIGVRYADAVQRMQPYHRIVQALHTMRQDTIEIVRQAVKQDRQVYVLVNNRAEGSAPLTVKALVDQLDPSG